MVFFPTMAFFSSPVPVVPRRPSPLRCRGTAGFQRGVLRTDARVVQARGDGVRLLDLTSGEFRGECMICPLSFYIYICILYYIMYYILLYYIISYHIILYYIKLYYIILLYIYIMLYLVYRSLIHISLDLSMRVDEY